MIAEKCPKCKNNLSSKAIFCGECGTQIKCTNCKEEISLKNKFCEYCGAQIGNRIESNASNTFSFEETSESRSIKAAFTDPVAKDMTHTIGNLLANKSLSLGTNNKRIEFENNSSETINIEPEEVFVDSVDNGSSQQVNKSENLNNVNPDDFPHINDVKKKMSFNEKDWIIIYAFYDSDFGKGIFTKDNVRAKYKEDRNTKSRMKKFYLNWDSAYKEAFATQREGELKFTSGGDKIARDLISGKKESKSSNSSTTRNNTSPRRNTKNGSKKTVAKSVKIEEFDAYNSKKTLENFMNELGNPKSTNDRIISIGYYIEKVLGSNNFTDGNIDYAYKILGLSNRPNHLRQTITNLKNDKVWLDKTDNKAWKVSRTGEIYVEKMLNR